MIKTITDARLIDALKGVNNYIDSNSIDDKINKEVENSVAIKAKLLKYYPYLSKALVEFDNKKVMCSVLHKCTGGMLDFFTPDGEIEFDNDLKSDYIIPQTNENCLVLKIKNSKEYVLLGYFYDNELQYGLPATPNSLKIICFGYPETYMLNFSEGKFEVVSQNGIKVEQSDYGESQDIIFADQKETYTKKEVNDIIKKLKEDNGLV